MNWEDLYQEQETEDGQECGHTERLCSLSKLHGLRWESQDEPGVTVESCEFECRDSISDEDIRSMLHHIGEELELSSGPFSGFYSLPCYQDDLLGLVESGEVECKDIVTDMDIHSMLQPKAKGVEQQKNQPDAQGDCSANRARQKVTALADQFVRKVLVMFLNGSLCWYNGRHWERLSEHESYVLLRDYAMENNIALNLNPAAYRDVLWLVKSTPEIQSNECLPVHHHLLNFLDGTLNLETLKMQPHDPDDYLFSCLDMYSSDMDRVSGRHFEQFIQCASAGNPMVRQQVLELIAIALTGLETKSFFAVIGPSGSGKSQLGQLILELVGENYVMNIRGMSDFGKQFSLGNIEGKRVVLCMDLPDTPLPAAAVGMIKQLVGDDAICVERKYQDACMVRHKPVFFCAGNHPIRIPNMSSEEAFLNRMVIIPFLGVPNEEEIVPQLHTALIEESAYIVGEAIGAYQSLVQCGNRPTRVKVHAQYAPKDARPEMVAVEDFLTTCCIFETDAVTTTQELYRSYCTFCDDEGEVPIAQNIFGRHLSEITRNMEVPVEPVKRAEGDSRGYRGIRLKNANDATT